MITRQSKLGKIEVKDGFIYVGVTNSSFLNKVLYDNNLSLDDNIEQAIRQVENQLKEIL